MIELKNIEKTYEENIEKTKAVDGISLKIAQGEMVAIMGPSGSGKSTLLNILGCLERPTRGQYLLNGNDVIGLKEKQIAQLRNQTFGFVVQDFALIERYSVEKNVMLPLYYTSIDRKQRRDKVNQTLELVHLSEKKHALARNLSGGQRQRVAIARAIINDANIIFCDEPTGALDKKTSGSIMQMFQKLNQMGKTIVIVTHDPEVASQCKRTIFIEDGKIK